MRAGDTVGLVGRNGAGKTSLLRVLGGMAPPKAGAVHRPQAFGYLPQDPRLDGVPDDVTPITRVLGGRALDELAARMEKLRLAMEERPGDEALVARWSRAHDAFEHADGYAADAEARRLLAGLGLRADRADKPIGVLSGGERRRVELARILFAGSELLMLDEPTNHLDNDARDWLLGYMRSYRGALLVISHDIELLDESITRVLHLDRPGEADIGTIVEYKGTYTPVREVAGRRRGPPGQGRRPPAGRDRPPPDPRRPLGREAVEGRLRQRPRDPHPPHPGRGRRRRRRPAAACACGCPTRRRRAAPSLDRQRAHEVLRRRARRCSTTCPSTSVGASGSSCSASTAPARRRCCASSPARPRPTAAPSSGATRSASGTTPRSTRASRPAAPLLEHMGEAAPQLGSEERRRLLGMFGLTGDKVAQDAGTLSGGEKTKLALALLVAGRRNLLLLDEPTNNLDPPSREAVAAALASWPGTMVIVSHDAGFVRDLAPDRALLMPDGDLDHWSEDLIDLVELA